VVAIYSFRIPSFHIGEIRSARTDTLHAAMALRVSNANGSLHRDFEPKSAALGDRKAGGDVVPNLSWENVFVPDPTPENPDGGSIAWTFLLINAGHTDSGFVAATNKAADAYAGALAGKSLDASTAAGAGAGVLFMLATAAVVAAQEVLNLLTANCDGGVASGAFNRTAVELANMTAGSNLTFGESQNNPGTDSPAGCGSNSSYDVNYQIQRVPILSLTQALHAEGITGLGAGVRHQIVAAGTPIGADFSLRDFVGH
jgi:hypothetical protein